MSPGRPQESQPEPREWPCRTARWAARPGPRYGQAGRDGGSENYDGNVAVVEQVIVSSLGSLYKQSSHSHWPNPRIQWKTE